MKPFGVFALLVRGVVWMVSMGVLTLLLASDVTVRLDNALYDLHMKHWRYRPSGDVVIVAIDAKSLEALGNWPWPRAIHARLIDRLTDLGVSAIGMNVLIVTPDTNHPDNDRLLARAIRNHGHVVMPMYAAASEPGGPLQVRLPIPEVTSAAASFCELDLPQDDDGLSRGAFLHGGVGRPDWPLLPLAIYQLDHPQSYAGPRPNIHGQPPYVWMLGDYMLLRYAGPAGTFDNISYVDVLNGSVDASLLKGKSVLIGMTAPGIGDRFITPGLRPGTLMPAVEYMANILESLRRGMLVVPLDLSQRFPLGMAALAFPLLIYGWPGLGRAWVVAVISVVATLLASLLLLRLANMWWPPVSAILIVMLESIIWGVLEPRLKRGRSIAARDISDRSIFELEQS